MTTLAIVALSMYGVGSLVFADWKRKVRYPKRSFAVNVTNGASELSFIALAIWVVVS